MESLKDIYRKSSLVMHPAAMKDGKLYSQVPHSGNGDFTFSRADGVQTRVNKHGLIETVANNTPRLSYDVVGGEVADCPHLLLEPSRTNLVTYSEDLSDSVYVKTRGTVTTNTEIAPDGTLTADTWTATDAIANLQGSVTVSNGVEYTMSVYLKRKTGTGQVSLRGVKNTSTAITLTDDWQRYSVALTTVDTAGRFGILLDTSGDEVYAWGFQLEEGSYATSYIPTSGSTETREADVCNNAGTSAEFNDSEGVLFLETSKLSTSDNGGVAISNSSYTYRVVLYFDNSGNVRGQVYSSGEQASIVTSGLDYTNNNKLALKYSATSTKFFVNGFQIGSTDTSSTMPIGLSELAFDDGGGSNDFYGKVKQIVVFNEALTDAELETLTS